MKPEMVRFLKEDQNGVQSYYKVDGKWLREKNPKPLQDDYVKFIHFAQWKIAQAGEGVLGFITNHNYLDNPTFRGMRQSLMQTFDEIYILDLHGNTRKKEKTPNGSKDENVFDIQQGVAIGIFIKKSKETATERKIFHSEIWGLREDKYSWLNSHNITNTRWKKVRPKPEFYLFIPRDERFLKQYETNPKITEIFPVNGVGIVTSRDNFAIAEDKEILKRRIRQFIDKNLSDDLIRQTYQLRDTDKFTLSDVRKKIMKTPDWETQIEKILYRPFDERWVFYNDAVIERPRTEVMLHMLKGKNRGLITVRQVAEGNFNHALATENIIDYRITMSARGGAYLFPLYLYPEQNNSEKRPSGSLTMVFDEKVPYRAKRPNLSPVLVEQLTEGYKKAPTPEQIFFYIYAVLYANTYRRKYAEFLKMDFPRIPFTSNYKLFIRMAEYGRKLVDLHLLKAEELEPPVAKFQGKGDNSVEKVRYEQGRVFINKEQFFEGIKQEIWNYQIGGYPVCAKWLKDRKGRRLSLEEIKHYCRIISSLQKTIAIQKSIDNIYPEVEKETIQFEKPGKNDNAS
jgi:predicted helicase